MPNKWKRRKSIRAATALLLVPTLFAAAAVAIPNEKSAHATTSTAGFERFRQEKNGWTILKDAAVRKCISSAMGNKEEEFWGCAQLSDVPIVTGDEVLVVAAVRGLYPFMQSVLCMNLATGKCTPAYLTDSKLHIFGANSESELPQSLKNYLQHYRKEYSSPELVFDKPDRHPVRTTKAPAPKTDVNVSTVTGTYRRAGPDRFVTGTLAVKALPGGKIYFDVDASSGGNTGEADGTVPLRNHIAVYKLDTSELRLQFNGKRVIITGDDSYFCGSGVTLLGTYTKIDNKAPEASARDKD